MIGEVYQGDTDVRLEQVKAGSPGITNEQSEQHALNGKEATAITHA